MANTDVVVIGAGLAGLTAAKTLADRGREVVVLEREDSVGGRQRSRTVDGFILDRGFQLLNPAYPALCEVADLDALDIHSFGSGVKVRREDGLKLLAHPFFQPLQAPRGLTSGLLQPKELINIARWLTPALLGPTKVLGKPGDKAVGKAWDELGIDGPLRREVLETFLPGVVAEDELETSNQVVQFLAALFVYGKPGLPARGVQALPEQLAAKAKKVGARISLETPVEKIEETNSGATVRTAGGDSIDAREVIVAVSPEVARSLIASLDDAPENLPYGTRGLTTWWFRADEAPSSEPFIAVDGTKRGPLVNSTIVTNSVPSYSPDGTPLVSASALIKPGETVSDDEARRHAAYLWGADTAKWDLLARDDIEHALPAQPAPSHKTEPARVGDHVLLAGDYRATGSIHGAIESSLAAARAF